MSTTKPAYQMLHRHRRKSSQASPTSPSFPRRLLDRPSRIVDPFSPVDSTSASTADSYSPSIDVDVPSPALEYTSASDVSQAQNNKRMAVRISEDNKRPPPHVLSSVTRPFTSDAVDTTYGLHAGPNGYAYDQNVRASPNMSNARVGDYNERLSSEGTGRSSSYSPNLRSFGPSSQTLDRAFQDDQGPTKLVSGKKSRLNLLNPMSLLARRRSSQNQNDPSNLSVSTKYVPALPDNFDPSIRGTITHDFSAPRSRRNHSYGGEGGLDSARSDFLSPGQPSPFEKTTPRPQPPSGPTPTHSPMFKEHFQDDRQTLRPGETGYLHNIASQNAAMSSDYGTSMPAFARKLPTRLPEHQTEDQQDNVNLDRPLPEPPTNPPPTPPTAAAPEEPREPPPPPPKRTPSPALNLPPPSALPKHMTSTSSRFSFQLGGSSSAQEKLLEEKHKEFDPGRRVSKMSRKEDVDEDDYDDYDFDADDGEEDIPMAGFENDPEDDSFRPNIDTPAHEGPSAIQNLVNLQQQSLQGFHFTPQSMTFSPTSTVHGSQPTPRDDKGFAIGIAGSRASPEYLHRPLDQQPPAVTEEEKAAFFDGLGITTNMNAAPHAARPQQTEAFDDDLYFDDGEFASDDYGPGPEAFDEDVFDDETKIRDIPAENLRKYEAAVKAAGSEGEIKVSASRSSAASSLKPVESRNSQKALPNLPGLTEGNLAAYHDALVNAANEAAANGKFRNVSFSQISDDEMSHSQSQVGIISDESRYSFNVNQSTIAEDDGFPFDDNGDDDLMIAEANAEALENDDEGFYGREFGFYARAHTKDNGTEMINGGYFGNRGSNGVKRSHSGKANFQEPSLTPITERSEWSTRNSVASLQIPPGFAIPGSANSLPSPGIAQLLEELDSAGSGYGDDSDMSLSALMKLRRGAFGGSSSSVNSMGGGHTGGSPLGHSHGPFSPQDHGHSRLMGSMHSMHSAGIPESEEEDDGFDEPTLTQNTPRKNKHAERSVDPSTPMDQPLMSPMSALSSSGGGEKGKGRRPHHRRNSSGAESVSYARETDGRWVLERRRTGDDGETEIEREFVGAGRI